MSPLALALAAALAPPAADVPPHDQNPLFREVREAGLSVGGVRVKLPEPTFPDGQTADEQAAALAKVAGSSRGAGEMVQPSLSAPHRLRLQDTPGDGVTVRSGTLVFVLRGVDLDALRPDEAFAKVRGEPVEAGNMRFRARVLTPDDLKGVPDSPEPGREWLAHATGRLLDRIAVESTDRVAASRSGESLVFASRTDPAFGTDGPFPNRWSTLTLKAGGDALGPPQPYAGGVGYVKLTRLKGHPGALAVEAHFAFAEPRAWFDGAPILRSKFGLIAQNEVRRLRRELARSRP